MDTNDTPEFNESPETDDAAETLRLPMTGDTPEADMPEAAAPESVGTPGTPRASFLRRHAVGVGVAAAVLAVVVVAGGTAWGVSAAVASTQTTAGSVMAPMSATHTGAPHAGRSQKHKLHGVSGTIATINGDTWTLHSASGKTVTVKLTSTTAFGTKKAPSTRDSFTVGEKVGVLGKRSGDTVTATRIVHLPLHTHTTAPTAAPTPSA